MEMIRHSEWAETKLTLHLLSQILGKIKLALAPQEPQWTHVTLPVALSGFSTGPLVQGETWLQLDVDVFQSHIRVQVGADTSVFPLEAGKSISTYYEEIMGALRANGVSVVLNPRTQEMRELRMLDRDDTPLAYDAVAAQRGIRLFQYAAREQLAFLAPLRCRKVKPGLFWGTFDVSSLIVYGRPEPFPQDKVIEKAAFDEHMVEFGFWLGDEAVDIPTFFILPYPFQYTEIGTERLKPQDAYYDAGKSEFFLSLENVGETRDVQAFFRTSFDILSEQLEWEGCDHYFMPLDMPKQQEPTDE
ncbi:DUF5996 family protein [Exiguobacterium aurantiacum]|uniref:DUF5996 family protein n=1 Tax=Exiguobacterium aurantiacum TaxID=33987 RepID=UPI0009F4C4C3|nr:DUF5996 family protein [Exiguobacterium aurantiacum]